MKIEGKIVLINNSEDEGILLNKVILKSCYDIEVQFFQDEQQALNYLIKTEDKIFLILCSYQLATCNGSEFKEKLESHPGLREKAIPFVFYSLSAGKNHVKEAYKYNLQGFFIQPIETQAQVKLMETIIGYWILNLHPHA
ncbi:response regulator [Fulvivirga sediminis]|uniref:Response regulatory domain-containing protein n=1 Tax=Fulvivirga sediminis TaxID=2803949 RepID=A0A937K2V4_9BACT|nr:hypothetical protein [Fulvivirga sediminis]MBL3658765.1 hypothetical protein [Fulvivirga sediminis]